LTDPAIFLCISANPAIDKRMRATRLRLGAVNRVLDVVAEPGGKAAHVAMAMQALGERPLWIGFAGGASGRELVAGLDALGIRTESVEARQSTRVNLAILDDAGVVTEILEPGGAVSPHELDLLRETCKQSFLQMSGHAYVVFSGSLPPGAAQDFYAELIRSARSAGCRTFLDTSGKALESALEQQPDFVKPNREEAELLTGEAITDLQGGRRAVSQILVRGARSVALSLGKDGLLWCPQPTERLYHARPPVVEARSSVGSGDATVAGFVYAIAHELSPEETARWAAACGAANCLASAPGQIKLSDVREMMKAIQVETIA
jgi:tagatose 6-phosphate kinase